MELEDLKKNRLAITLLLQPSQRKSRKIEPIVFDWSEERPRSMTVVDECAELLYPQNSGKDDDVLLKSAHGE